jgi:hypothetical protein
MVVLTAAVVLWSCSGDPTEPGATRIVANPSALFLTQGQSGTVTVQLVDEQGSQYDADFEPSGGAGLTVTRDPTFLPVPGGQLATASRFAVVANEVGATSFTVTGGDASLDIPVRVLPPSLGATLSSATPAQNEPVTVTLPTGYKFVPGARVSSDQGPGIVQSVAPDSSSLVVVLPLGSNGPLILDSMQTPILPAVTLAGVPTEASIAIDSTPLPGTGSIATAPTMAVPAIGDTTGFFDRGVFTAADITGDGGVGAQYYQLVVTEAADYIVTVNWPAGSTADIDGVLCFDASCGGGSLEGFLGTGVGHPERARLTLDPGTYYLAVVLFTGGATPINVQIEAVPPIPTATSQATP